MAKATINQAALQRVAQQAARTAEARINEAVNAAAAAAGGRSTAEVESTLRAEMSARGIAPKDTASLAAQIATAVNGSA